MKTYKQKLKAGFYILLIAVFFILSSYIIQKNLINLEISKNFGALIYIFITIIAIVIAPISMIPLIPIAANLFGWFLTAIYSIIGWTIGSFIAFFLAQNYGKPLIKKFISLKKIEKLEKYIPQENIFWSVVFLRIVIPVDILSYALGLFSNMKKRSFVLATIIGILPFAFIFSYLGGLPVIYQIFGLILGIFIFLIGVSIAVKKQKR